MNDNITYKPIGIIHTPFTKLDGMPIQPTGAAGVKGTVEVFPEYAEGLGDLDGFSHIMLLYHFHKVRAAKLTVVPFLDTEPHGVFATRAPRRPNPIGLSVVRLVGVECNVLSIENVDMLDGTPLRDIKPFVPDLDQGAVDRIGWLEGAAKKARARGSDGRFE
jgi:tRNA-Thr(GGU) m(6)t(6)A37 methyltransferase TsaA